MKRIGPKRAPTPTEREMRVERAKQAAEARKTAGAPPWLAGALEVAVPMWVQRFRDEKRTWESLRLEAQQVANDICLSAPALEYVLKGYEPSEKLKASLRADGFDGPWENGLNSAAMFNQLAKGLAIGSFVPGGASFVGLHWQSDPAWLRGDA